MANLNDAPTAGPNHSRVSNNKALPGIIKPGRSTIPKVKVTQAPPPGSTPAPSTPKPN